MKKKIYYCWSTNNCVVVSEWWAHHYHSRPWFDLLLELVFQNIRQLPGAGQKLLAYSTGRIKLSRTSKLEGEKELGKITWQ